MTEFNPSRLALARESLGWTRTTLASKAGMTARRLADYENRGVCPPADTLRTLAEVLKVDVAFLLAHDLREPTNLSFRSLSTMTAGVRDRAVAAAKMTSEVGEWVTDRFQLQAADLPRDLAGADPSIAAAVLREQWGFGIQPAPNLVQLAELMGIRVFALSVDERALDAFSFWDGETPYILINARGTAERRRWDVAHEIGHLLLHAGSHHLPTDRGREDEADQFAGALLLPAEGLRKDAMRVRTLDEVRRYKLRWKVSAVAMIRTLHRQGHLTEWEYRTLAIDASKAKLRRIEDDIPAETSPVLTAVVAELRKRRLGPGHIARELALRTTDVRNMFHTLAPVDMSDLTDTPRRTTTSARPSLRLVE